MPNLYRVSADIKYLDGTLAGIVVPSGYRVTYPDRTAAIRCTQWLERVQREDDFIRAPITGNRYKVVGGVSYIATARLTSPVPE